MDAKPPSSEKAEAILPEIVFGASNVRNSLGEIQGETRELAYLAGKAIVRRELLTFKTRVDRLSDNVESVYFMGVCPDSSCVIVSQKVYKDESMVLGIYDLQHNSKKTFKIASPKEGNYFKLFDFAAMDPYLAVLTTHSNEVYVVNLRKLRHIAYYNLDKQAINCVKICVGDSHLISVSSKDSIKLYRAQEYTFKPLEPIKNLPIRRFTQHVWGANGLFIGTQEGSMLWAFPSNEGYQVKREFPIGSPVLYLVEHLSKVLSISEDSKITLWQSDYQNIDLSYQTTRMWILPSGRAKAIQSVLVTSKLQQLIFAFEDSHIAVSNLEEMYQKGPLTQQLTMQFLYRGFHCDAISSMDRGLQRPILVSSSKIDRSIRVWNYLLDRCDLVKYHNKKDNPFVEALAVHPSGYYMAVGFEDKLTLFHILNNDIRDYKETLLQGVSFVGFSEAGAYLVVCCSKGTDTFTSWELILMNSYTLELVYSFLDWNSPIVSVKFCRQDTCMVAMCSGGSIRLCSIGREVVTQNIASRSQRIYTSMAIYSPKNTKGKEPISMFSCSPNPKQGCVVRECKEVAKKYVERIFEVKEYNISCLEVFLHEQKQSHRLIAGSAEGLLILYKVPFDGIPLCILNLHNSPITCLKLSPCTSKLFSGCKSGLLVVSRLQEEKSVQKLAVTQAVDESLSDIMLVPISNLVQTEQKNQKLLTGLNEIEHRSCEIQSDLRQRFRDEIEKLTKEKNKEIESFKELLKEKTLQSEQATQRHSDQLQKMEKRNQQALSQLQALFNRKVYMESDENAKLKRQVTVEEQKYRDELHKVEEFHEENVRMLTSEFEAMLSNTASAYKKVASKRQYSDKVFEEKLREVDEEYQQEIQDLINRHEQQEGKLKEILGKLGNQVQTLKSELKAANTIMRTKDQRILELNERIEDLQEARNNQQKDIKEMDQLLSQKKVFLTEGHQKINDLKSRYKDLEKKKNIINSKAIEWREAVEPREDEINRLKTKLNELQLEMDAMIRKQELSISHVESLETQRLKLTKVNKVEGLRIKALQTQSINIMSDVKSILDRPKDSNRVIYDEVIALYKKYNASKSVQGASLEGMGEINRQVMHLERALDIHTKSSVKTLEHRNLELTKRSAENNELIRDLNDYKVRNKDQTLEIKLKQKIIDDLLSEKNKLSKKSVMGEKTPGPKLPLTLARSTSTKSNKVLRGSNFEPVTVSLFEKNKLAEISSQNELLRQYIKKLESNEASLKDKVLRHARLCQVKDRQLEDIFNS